jgi:hypothetical protein
VTLQVHLIVEYPADFNDPAFHGAIEEKMATAPTVPSYMERAQARRDVISCSRSGRIGTFREFADRLHQGIAIDRGLSRPEILIRPFEDICEIDFRGSAEANAPLPRDHDTSFARAGNNLVRNSIKIGLEVIDVIELLELTSIQCAKTCASRLT